jgi:hypothetical protein
MAASMTWQSDQGQPQLKNPQNYSGAKISLAFKYAYKSVVTDKLSFGNDEFICGSALSKNPGIAEGA